MRGFVALAILGGGCGFHLPAAGSDPATDAAPTADTPTVDMPPAGDAPPFAITGARWELPCTGGTGDPDLCDCTGSALSQNLQIGGAPLERWHVTVRIRGVMEKMTYQGGAIAGTWYSGGAPSDTNWNFYRLAITKPPQVYFLNPGTQLVQHSDAFDYTETFDIDAGATVTFAVDGQDSFQWRGVDQNGVVISIAGVTDPPQPFDGQYARIDVMTAVAF